MLLLFQCRKCGKFFCRSKHYTTFVPNICCLKIITSCNINRQRIFMIPCSIFDGNPEYGCEHIFHSPFNSIYFILTQSMLKVKFLSYSQFSKNVNKNCNAAERIRCAILFNNQSTYPTAVTGIAQLGEIHTSMLLIFSNYFQLHFHIYRA